MSFLVTVLLFIPETAGNNPWWIAFLFFALGFFSSCQTMGFTWIIQGMRKELIGRNSAFNSVIFMGTNGIFKQFGAYLLGIPALLIGLNSARNLMLAMAIAMLIAAIYASFRNLIFSQDRTVTTMEQTNPVPLAQTEQA